MPVSVKTKNERVHAALKQALDEKGLTHDEVAKILGVSKQTVSNRISNGVFTAKMAQQWSNALHIPLSVFFDGIDLLPDTAYDAIKFDIANLKHEVEVLRKEVEDLKRRSQ